MITFQHFPYPNKPLKKRIQQFYQAQHANVSFLGHDHLFTLSTNDKVICAAVVSFLDHNAFLHALVTNNQYRKQGLASQLLQAINQQISPPYYCFAQPSLLPFYTRLNWCVIEKQHLPACLATRYSSYKKNATNLMAFKFDAIQLRDCQRAPLIPSQ